MKNESQFDIALSFAGEDREYVEKVANILIRMGFRVFYDKYEIITLWGKNLLDHLQDVYQNKAKYTVMFISKHYAQKVWTNHERKSAQVKAFISNKEYILPVRFDDTEIPGILPTIFYINASEYSPEQLSELIKKKVGPTRRIEFLPKELNNLFKEVKARTKKLKEEASIFVDNFFKQLMLMTIEERVLIYETIINSCPAEFPDNVHLRSDYLSRITKKPSQEILAMYSRLDCLGIAVKVRKSTNEEDKLCKESEIIQIEYKPLKTNPICRENATYIPIAIVRIIAEHLCAECAKKAFINLDFSLLSSLAGFPEK